MSGSGRYQECYNKQNICTISGKKHFDAKKRRKSDLLWLRKQC